MTLLEDLWYGNLNPHEAILTENRRYKHLLSLMGRNRNELAETLTDKQLGTLEKYDEAMNETHSRETRLHTSKKLQQKILSFAFHHIHIFIRPRQILKIIIRKLFFCSALRCNNHKNCVCRRPS